MIFDRRTQILLQSQRSAGSQSDALHNLMELGLSLHFTFHASRFMF